MFIFQVEVLATVNVKNWRCLSIIL